MTSVHTERKPLAYHYHVATPESPYGRGACGTHGMMATSPMSVTCERCLKTPQFAAALNIASRFAGSDALTDENEVAR